MILSKGEIITPNGRDAWNDLPGIAVLVGGMWVANFYYWGFNLYIIHRTLASKSLEEGQKGIAFAAFLKLIIPIIVVLPGMIAYVMNLDETGNLTKQSVDAGFIGINGNIINDNAAPWLIKNFIPAGIKGLILAALSAAILSFFPTKYDDANAALEVMLTNFSIKFLFPHMLGLVADTYQHALSILSTLSKNMDYLREHIKEQKEFYLVTQLKS